MSMIMCIVENVMNYQDNLAATYMSESSYNLIKNLKEKEQIYFLIKILHYWKLLQDLISNWNI